MAGSLRAFRFHKVDESNPDDRRVDWNSPFGGNGLQFLAIIRSLNIEKPYSFRLTNILQPELTNLV